MIDPANVPDVDSQEMTARFVVSKSHFNKQTLTLKANAFVPPPNRELSVTRLVKITEDEIWAVGKSVAAARKQTLRGRGDVLVATYLDQKLEVIPDPVDNNPNHANVTGWPSADDKAMQVMIAKEIAAVAKFVETPEP